MMSVSGRTLNCAVITFVAVVVLSGTTVRAAPQSGTAAPGVPQGPVAIGPAAQATRAFAAHDKTRSFLISMLGNPNEYLRKLALEHLLEARGKVASPVITAVVPRLVETTPLPSAWCAEMYERQQAGIKEEDDDTEGPSFARDCGPSYRVSNGSLAARILVVRSTFPAVIAFVQRQPKAAEAVVASLGPAGLGPASQVLPALAASKQPDVQAALLRLIIATPCETAQAARTTKSVSAFAGSSSAAVSRMASLAVLHLIACGPHDAEVEGTRKQAASALETALQNLDDHEIVPQIGWLGPAGDALMDPLLARFARLPVAQTGRGAILRVFAHIGPGASSATPVLIGVLQDPKQVPLWTSARDAVGSIGPAAAAAKSAMMCELRESSFVLLEPVVTTLARIDAKLDSAEFVSLVQAYRKECEGGGGMPTESGNDLCPEVSKSLIRLAKLAGQAFRSDQTTSRTLPTPPS